MYEWKRNDGSSRWRLISRKQRPITRSENWRRDIIKSSSLVRAHSGFSGSVFLYYSAERQKVVRKIAQTKKSLESANDSKSKKKLEKTLYRLRVDLNYIIVRTQLSVLSYPFNSDYRTSPSSRNTSPYSHHLRNPTNHQSIPHPLTRSARKFEHGWTSR